METKTETKTKKWYQNKKALMGVVALIVVVIAMIFVYNALKPQPTQGTKAVKLEVTSADGEQTIYDTKTDAEFLKEVMDELAEQGFSYGGAESEFGLMIDTVNGELASFEENGSFWGIYVNGEFANYGISEQPVADGDIFGLAYTAG